MEEKIQIIRERFHIQFIVPKSLVKDKTAEDIMMENGYHPAGYGQPYQLKVHEDSIEFKCSNSCD